MRTFRKIAFWALMVATGACLVGIIFFFADVNDQELGCKDPEKSGTLSSCVTTTGRPPIVAIPSTTTRSPTMTTTTMPPRTTSVVPSTVTPTPTPHTSAPPLFAPVGPPPRAIATPSSTTTTTTARQTTTTAQAPTMTVGTLDTYGTEQQCSGFLVPMGGKQHDSGVDFAVNMGPNNVPRVTITGQNRNGYTYSDLRVVTGDTFNVGHTHNGAAISVPGGGPVNMGLDVSNTTGKPTKGVLVCL